MSAEQLSLSFGAAIDKRVKDCTNCKILKEQCTAALRQWDKALREYNEAKTQLSKVQQQRDEAMKQINEAMNLRIKASKDLTRLMEERNAAVQEYSLVMSERDSVHKEIEKSQEELQQCVKKVKLLEQEKRAISIENESLKREIVSLTREKEQLIKAKEATFPLRSQWGSTSSGVSSQGHSVSVLSFTNLNQSADDFERIRLKNEELQQQLEIAKRQYEWAFGERDKIVLERESIRVLCDKYRRERDRAVSELAKALTDSEDMKSQRNFAAVELNDLNNQFTSHINNKHTQSLSRSACRKIKQRMIDKNAQLSTPRPTLLDKAYNEIYGSHSNQNANMDGNENNTSVQNSVVLTQKTKNIVHKKSNSLKGVSSHLATIRSQSETPSLCTVEWLSPPLGSKSGSQRSPKSGDVRCIYVEKGAEPLGIQISDPKAGGGIFVTSVFDDSIASKSGLRVGDQLLEVCGINMRNATFTSAANILRHCGDNIRMLVQYNPQKLTEQMLDTQTVGDLEYACNPVLHLSKSFYSLRVNRKDNERNVKKRDF
ncbi:discs large protein-like protein [Leptotrombidium deliense]|uniref:Discs large protein-like protein n=1 Tax=Leptotrombidium deliense TaxID=299467 RepID=A0A443S4L6_9ACAR|nr:discs large protein-like protein [Leptotrombidium deliense]